MQGYRAAVQQLTLYAQAPEILTKLAEYGVQHYIISAYEHVHLNDLVNSFDIHHLFKGIYGLQKNAVLHKVTLGQQAMRQHQINPETCLIIGDTLHDFELSQALNTHIILLASGHNSYQKLIETGAPTLHHFNELKMYLIDAFSKQSMIDS